MVEKVKEKAKFQLKMRCVAIKITFLVENMVGLVLFRKIWEFFGTFGPDGKTKFLKSLLPF